MTGRLVLVAAPIGNPADASARLVSTLAQADVIAAEDTRRFKRLCSDLGVEISGRVVSYFEANEVERTSQLLDDLQRGATVAVITDAGMPSVSDPGYRLVSAAVDAGITVTATPGPSAVLMALALSGLPSDRFCFEGFLPRKSGERAKALASLSSEVRTMIFFEAPHRLAASLTAMKDVFGSDRSAAVCRELTKTYEEIRRGTLAELEPWAADGVKGEITVVVHGASPSPAIHDPAQWVLLVQEFQESGMSRKDAIAEVSEGLGVRKREVFDAVVAARAKA